MRRTILKFKDKIQIYFASNLAEVQKSNCIEGTKAGGGQAESLTRRLGTSESESVMIYFTDYIIMNVCTGTTSSDFHRDESVDHSIQMDVLGHRSLESSPSILHGPRPSEKRYGFLALYNNDYVVGIGLLLLVVLLWTLSSFLTQVCPALFHIVYQLAFLPA